MARVVQSAYPSHQVGCCVLHFQRQAHSWARAVGIHDAVDGFAESIKKHPLDADVIVKKLHVNRPRNSAADMQVHTGAAMRGKRYIRSPAQGSGIHEAR